MSISLDVGLDSLKTMRRVGNQLVAKRCRSLFSVLADSPERRDVLEKMSIPYSTAEDQIIVPVGVDIGERAGRGEIEAIRQ